MSELSLGKVASLCMLNWVQEIYEEHSKYAFGIKKVYLKLVYNTKRKLTISISITIISTNLWSLRNLTSNEKLIS